MANGCFDNSRMIVANNRQLNRGMSGQYHTRSLFFRGKSISTASLDLIVRMIKCVPAKQRGELIPYAIKRWTNTKVDMMKLWLKNLLLLLLLLVESSIMLTQAADQQNVRGRVLDESGKPIAAAELMLVIKGRWAKTNLDLVYHSGNTDAHGNFKFDSGEFVEAWLLARYRYSPSDIWHFAETPKFTFKDAEKEARTIRFLANAPTMTGRILDECENGVEGATVAAYPAPGHCFATPRLMDWHGSDPPANVAYLAKTYLAATTSDTNGNFTIRGLCPGQYSILAACQDFNVLERPIGMVKEGQRLNQDLKLLTASQSGQLTLAGKVTDQHRKPVSDVQVVATDERGADRGVVWTNKNGIFRLTNLQKARWTVAVKNPSEQTELSRSPIQTATNTAIVLPVTLLTVDGSVVLPDGKPADNDATVEISSTYWNMSRVKKIDRGNNHGRFSFDQVPPGPITLMAKVGGFREAVRTMESDRAKSVVLQVVPECTIAVKVINEYSGEPLAGVGVEISETIERDLHVRLAGHTRSDGTFTDTHVRTGNIRVLARNPGGKHATVALEVIPGKLNLPITLKINRSGRIEAIVVDAQGNPIDVEMVLEAWPVTRFFGIAYDASQGCVKAPSATHNSVVKVAPGEYDVRASVKLKGRQYSQITGRSLLINQPMEMLTDSVRIRIGQNQSKSLKLHVLAK